MRRLIVILGLLAFMVTGHSAVARDSGTWDALNRQWVAQQAAQAKLDAQFKALQAEAAKMTSASHGKGKVQHKATY